jgi:hypothetical protein
MRNYKTGASQRSHAHAPAFRSIRNRRVALGEPYAWRIVRVFDHDQASSCHVCVIAGDQETAMRTASWMRASEWMPLPDVERKDAQPGVTCTLIAWLSCLQPLAERTLSVDIDAVFVGACIHSRRCKLPAEHELCLRRWLRLDSKDADRPRLVFVQGKAEAGRASARCASHALVAVTPSLEAFITR